jgi:hypothetical protein
MSDIVVAMSVDDDRKRKNDRQGNDDKRMPGYTP